MERYGRKMIDIEKLKKEITSRLLPLNPEKIIIFGSYAYGTPTANSDLDICVVEKKYKSKIQEKAKIDFLLKDIRIAKDILVPTSEEYNFYKKKINSVYNDIDTRGEVLWTSS